MTNLDPFLALNALSGLFLVALGGWSAFRPGQKLGLPLFLVAFGSQVALTNAAVSPGAGSAAPLLFWLSMLFLPLQGLLALYFVAQLARDNLEEASSRRAYMISFWACLAIAVCMAIAVAFTSVPAWREQLSDTDLAVKSTWLPTLLFDATQFIAISTALLLMTWLTPTRENRLIITGLGFAWTYSLAFSISVLAAEQAVFETIIAGGSLLVALFAVGRNLRISAQLDGINWKAALTWTSFVGALTFATAVYFLPKPTDGITTWTDPLTWSAPGLFRMLALFWLVPALSYRGFLDAARQPNGQVRVLTLGFTVAAVTAATVTVGLDTELWTAYAAGLVLVAGMLLFLMAGEQVRHLLDARTV